MTQPYDHDDDQAGLEVPAELDAPRLPGRRCRVVLADGTEFTARITNRDYIAWDMTAPKKRWGKAADVPFLAATFLAWSAARRDGLTALPFEAFRDAADVVDNLPEDDDEDDDAGRPTRTGPAPV